MAAMATWVVGDVQGCHRTLVRLLDRASPASSDRLLFVGDLVNRGTGSLEVLRWAAAQGDRIQVVLGNHDLHLLACAEGARRPKARDTIEPILEARDRGDLLDWLAARPLLRRLEVGAEQVLLVHAGVLPEWTASQAERLAHEVEDHLRGSRRATLVALQEPAPTAWSADLAGADRLRIATTGLTRLRLLTAAGEIETEFNGAPRAAPAGCVPWFEAPRRRTADVTVVFGHWAALGLHIAPRVVALDSGAVWGRALTAMRLDDRAVVQEPTARADLP